jgi:hypothetical protein
MAENRRCNCENSHCDQHLPGICTKPAGDTYIDQLGFVCDDCAAKYPAEYHVANLRRHTA